MRRGSKIYVPTPLDCMWRMGGRICDLSIDQLDHLAVQLATTRWRPPEVERAQAEMDACARRKEVRHA